MTIMYAVLLWIIVAGDQFYDNEYIDPNYENVLLSFDEAKYYAQCYPFCLNEPPFNGFQTSQPSAQRIDVENQALLDSEFCPNPSFVNEAHQTVKDGRRGRETPPYKIPNSNMLNKDDPLIVCDDHKTFCPGGTCCKMNNGQYGCCPFLSGKCCSNQIQCCPYDYQCVDSPNQTRNILRSFFGYPPMEPEIRCRLSLSLWISTQFEFKNAKP
eukprot:571606_1